MIDPSDLLSTNRFVSQQNNNKKKLFNQSYKHTPTKQEGNQSRTFLQHDIYQNSNINRSKREVRQWPPTNDKTVYPILSKEIRDISDNRYSKYKITYISIDSRDGVSGLTAVPIGSENNCSAVADSGVLADATVNSQCTAPTVNNDYKIFLREKFENVVSIKLVDAQIQNPFFPSKFKWYYPSSLNTNTSLSNVDLINNNEYTLPTTLIEHEVEMPFGSYFTEDYLKQLEDKVNSVVNSVDAQYNLNKHHQMNFRMSKDKSSTIIINRMERFSPMLVYTAITQDDDYIGNLSFNTVLSSSNIEKYVYFILSGVNDDLGTELPIIWVDLEEVGGVPFDQLNYVGIRYWDGTGLEPSVSYFEDVDTVKLISGGVDYRRYRMKIFNNAESLASYPTHSEQYGAKFLLNYWNSSLASTEGLFPMNVFDQFSTVGRGYPFSIENNDQSVIRMLGFGPNKGSFDYVLNVYKSSDKTFHTTIPPCITDVYGSPGTYVGCDYLYLLLNFPSQESDPLGGSLIKAGTSQMRLTQDSDSKYINNFGNLFAKIVFKRGNPVQSEVACGEKQFIEKPVDRLDEFGVQIINKDGKLINFERSSHNFTLQIMEKIEVLKETQYDSKRGRPVTTNYFSTNPLM